MSPSETVEPVRLVITSEDRPAAILVSNAAFKSVASGGSRLSVGLPPGLYQVEVSAGGKIERRIVALRRDAVDLHIHQLDFAATAPLENTRKTLKYHEAAAALQSREVHSKRGRGGELFVFARHWSALANDGTERPHPALGLTLHDVSGRLLVEPQREGQSDLLVRDPWCACNSELDPGIYRLRVDTPVGTLEQAITVSRGFQTQVFLLSRPYQDGSESVRASLASASIFLAPLVEGFDPRNSELRLAELALNALTDRSVPVLEGDLEAMRLAVPRNPLLGIVAAHLLLRCGRLGDARLRPLIEELRARLGAHPDVEALALRLEAAPHDHELPPMLLRSWPLILEGTSRRTDRMPRDSLAAKVSERLWGEGPWLLWTRPDESAGLESLNIARFTASTSSTGDDGAALDLSATEEAVRPYLYPSLLGWEMRPRGDRAVALVQSEVSAGGPWSLPDELASMLVRAIGLPKVVIEDAAADLLVKLGPIPEAPDGRLLSPWPRAFKPRRESSGSFDPADVERHRLGLLMRAERQQKPPFKRVFLSAALFWQRWLIDHEVRRPDPGLSEALTLAEGAGEWPQVVALLEIARATPSVPRHRRFLRDWTKRLEREGGSHAKRLETLKMMLIELRSSPTAELGERIEHDVFEWAPPSLGSYLLGRVCSTLGQQAKAEVAFSMAVLCNPLRTGMVVLLAMEQGRRSPEAALATLSEAEAALGAVPRLRVHRANLLWQIWVRDERIGAPPVMDAMDALDALRSAGRNEPTPGERALGYLVAAFCQRASEGAAAALSLLEEARRAQPEDPYVLMALGMAHLEASGPAQRTTTIFEEAAARARGDDLLRAYALRAADTARGSARPITRVDVSSPAERYFEQRFIPYDRMEAAIDVAEATG